MLTKYCNHRTELSMKDILTAVNPDVSGIQLSERGPDRDRLAIVGDGNRCAKPIAVRLPDDVLADLVPSGRAEIVSAAHQGEDPHVSWPIKCIKPRRAADYSHAVGSDMYRLAKPVFGCIFVDGLAERHPVSAIVVSTIDFDVALIIVTPGSAHHKCTCAGRESHQKSQLITSSI